MAGIEALTGAAAILGGITLLHGGFGMPVSWLRQTPFTSWAWPGIALLACVALPQLGAAALAVAGPRRGIGAGYLAGALLIGWIAAEVLMLQRYQVLQPVVAGLGLAEILLARAWHRDRLRRPSGGSNATSAAAPAGYRR